MSEATSVTTNLTTTIRIFCITENSNQGRGRGRGRYRRVKKNYKQKPKFKEAEESLNEHICNIDKPSQPNEFIVTIKTIRDYIYRTFNS